MNRVEALAAEARRLGLAGDFAGGHRLLDEAETMAGDEPVHLARIAIERGRLLNTAGDPAGAMPYFVSSWDLARAGGNHQLAVDAAHMAAIAAEVESAEAWVATAEAYIDTHPETRHWRPMLKNNLGWTQFEAGRLDKALATFHEAMALYDAAGTTRERRIARYTVIRTLRALERIPEAIALGEEVVAAADARGDSAPYVYEELAECFAAMGDAPRSAGYARRAVAILGADGAFTTQEPARLARLRQLAG